MDKNALTEQRRETVIGLLKGMDIKKSTEGGFDRDDVYDCMQKLCDLYEKSIEELENNYEEELISLKDKYQKYDDNNELYVSLIMEAKKSSNEIINQAKTEVETVLNEGKAAAAQQEEELAMGQRALEAEKAAMAEELEASKKATEAEKAAIRAELEAEKEKVYAMKNRYNQQLNSMEEEFSEIKTNILRTSGKIDSLKSKLHQDDEIIWKVAEEARSVEFPMPEIQVEETIEPVMQPAVDVSAPEAFVQSEPEVFAQPAPEAVSESEGFVQQQTADSVAGGFADSSFTDNIFQQTQEAAPEAVEQPEAVQEAAPEAFTLDDLSLDDINIDLPDLESKPADAADTQAVEEISFEGLEELFKEDK